MNRSQFAALRNPDTRSQLAWLALRWLLAGLIAAHGWVRFVGGGVEPFGQWLVGQGLPMGLAIAIAVTAIEILGTPLFALGKFVPPLAVLYSAIYAVGIAMVHACQVAGGSGMRPGILKFSGEQDMVWSSSLIPRRKSRCRA